jgi:hypothetical protein
MTPAGEPSPGGQVARNDNPYYVIARLTKSDEAILGRGMRKLDRLIKYG